MRVEDVRLFNSVSSSQFYLPHSGNNEVSSLTLWYHFIPSETNETSEEITPDMDVLWRFHGFQNVEPS